MTFLNSNRFAALNQFLTTVSGCDQQYHIQSIIFCNNAASTSSTYLIVADGMGRVYSLGFSDHSAFRHRIPIDPAVPVAAMVAEVQANAPLNCKINFSSDVAFFGIHEAKPYKYADVQSLKNKCAIERSFSSDVCYIKRVDLRHHGKTLVVTYTSYHNPNVDKEEVTYVNFIPHTNFADFRLIKFLTSRYSTAKAKLLFYNNHDAQMDKYLRAQNNFKMDAKRPNSWIYGQKGSPEYV